MRPRHGGRMTPVPNRALKALGRWALRIAAAAQEPGTPLLFAVFAAAGAGLYIPAAAVNSILGDRFALPFAVSVLPEEALKLGMAWAAAALARRLGDPGKGLAAVAGATGFAAAENLAYLRAFPDASVFLRLGWALPLHVNGTALFALALASRRPGAAAAAALIAAAAFHAAFNAAAAANPAPLAVAGGIAMNLGICAGLAFAARLRFAWGGILDGKPRL